MKHRLVAAIVLLLVSPVLALDGQPGIHDPSTVVMHGGKYYTYGTGAGLPILVSDDGWTWRRAGTLMQALPGGRPSPPFDGHERKRADVRGEDWEGVFLRVDHLAHMRVVKVVAKAPMARRREHEQAQRVKHDLCQSRSRQQRAVHEIVIHE